MPRPLLRLALTTALVGLPAWAHAQVGSLDTGFADLVRKVAPAVVNITVETDAGLARIPRGAIPPGGGLVTGVGSGFFIESDGIIVTNNHVVEGATSIQVETDTGEILDATLVGSDPLTDLAVLDVEGEGFATVAFADSDQVDVGDWALAVGNPLGQGFSASLGIVSARGRTLNGAFDDYIQTDAAINQGNSGGPLFDTQGRVMGINTAILSPNGGSIGIGFSMSANVAKSVVEQLRTHGETRRGWLGVQIQPITPDIATALGLDSTQGALIAGVIDGPAKEAGVRAGDVVVAVNGTPIRSAQDLTRATAAAAPDSSVRLDVLRDNAPTEITVVLGRREEAEAALNTPKVEEGPKTATTMGIQVGALGAAELRAQGLPEGLQGVLVVGAEGSAGTVLEAGDIIVAISQIPTPTPDAFTKALEALQGAGRPLGLVQALREGRPLFIALPITRE